MEKNTMLHHNKRRGKNARRHTGNTNKANGTAVWITGLNCLTIPCEPASKRGMEPLYIYDGLLRSVDYNVAYSYMCPRCGYFFVGIKPARMHMGLIANMGSTCPAM